jgi:hypothetical protein
VQESTVFPHFFDLCTKKEGNGAQNTPGMGCFVPSPSGHTGKERRARRSWSFLIVGEAKTGFLGGGRSKRPFPTHGKKAPTSGLVENFTPRAAFGQFGTLRL